ncbi:serine/threonine-protein kinase [Streptomyces sp. NPDC048357]|uniref:serine/threonine protein kinase n=1 Tax=Streptomyces sp. NPDC048357 TaxID=3154719 RepID=UPI00342EABD3
MQSLTDDDPSHISSYRLLGRLGAGGMGTVYAAAAPDGSTVAVKAMHSAFASDDDHRARFAREMDLLRRVHGPYVAAFVDGDATASRPWLASQYVPGPTLRERLTASGPLPDAVLRSLAGATAHALAGFHSAGVVHRDIKPENVILGPAGPRVLDFGIAHRLGAPAITDPNARTGTRGWMAPEQYTAAVTSPASDVFAWGLLVAYAGTGRHPFDDRARDTGATGGGEPDLLGLPDVLRRLVASALSMEPSRRPSAARLAHDIAEPERRADTLVFPTVAYTAVEPLTEPLAAALVDVVRAGWDVREEPGQEEEREAPTDRSGPPRPRPALPVPPRVVGPAVREERATAWATVVGALAVAATVVGVGFSPLWAGDDGERAAAPPSARATPAAPPPLTPTPSAAPTPTPSATPTPSRSASPYPSLGGIPATTPPASFWLPTAEQWKAAERIDPLPEGSGERRTRAQDFAMTIAYDRNLTPSTGDIRIRLDRATGTIFAMGAPSMGIRTPDDTKPGHLPMPIYAGSFLRDSVTGGSKWLEPGYGQGEPTPATTGPKVFRRYAVGYLGADGVPVFVYAGGLDDQGSELGSGLLAPWDKVLAEAEKPLITD